MTNLIFFVTAALVSHGFHLLYVLMQEATNIDGLGCRILVSRHTSHSSIVSGLGIFSRLGENSQDRFWRQDLRNIIHCHRGVLYWLLLAFLGHCEWRKDIIPFIYLRLTGTHNFQRLLILSPFYNTSLLSADLVGHLVSGAWRYILLYRIICKFFEPWRRWHSTHNAESDCYS
jgi:hypothetical protein